MVERGLPPIQGVLSGRGNALVFEKWQKVLLGLSQPEGLLALALGLASIPKAIDLKTQEKLVLLLLLLLVTQAQGSSFLPLGDQTMLAELQKPFDDSPNDWRTLLEREEVRCLWAAPGAPLHLEGGYLYSRRMLVPEETLAELAQMRSRTAPVAREVPDGLLFVPDRLDPYQEAAVRGAANQSLTLVTGGPGTGKTSIVVAMLRTLVSGAKPLSMDQVLLAAPTARAAIRMKDSIRSSLGRLKQAELLTPEDEKIQAIEPKTLHLLLGFNPRTNTFFYNRDNPLPAQVVIVDEASMIGIEIMSALFAAVPPEAQLVILGDSDQLPSVEAGRAFRDLRVALPGCTCVLAHSWRMDAGDPGGKQILLAAGAINLGEPDAFWNPELAIPFRERFAITQGSGVEVLAPSVENLKGFCSDWAADQYWVLRSEDGTKVGALGDLVFKPLVHLGDKDPFHADDLGRVRRALLHFDRTRILCPVHLGAELRSVKSLNEFFHHRAVAMAIQHGGLKTEPALIAGEPVMVKHNDYLRGIYNGDQGIIMLVEKDGQTQRQVFFPTGEGFCHFPLATIREELDLCYAMTVHKTQGSEYQQIALILPERPGPLLTREILYTALTRAKKAATIIGTQPDIDACMQKPVLRWSGLETRIRAIPST